MLLRVSLCCPLLLVNMMILIQSNVLKIRGVKRQAHRYHILKKSVKIILNGINSIQKYVSDLVLINLKLNNEVRSISALTIPKIDFSLKFDNLYKVIDHFKDKGYKFAD